MDAFTIYAFVCLLFAAFNQGQASNQCQITEPYFCNNKGNGNYANHDYYHGYYACSNKNIFCMECAKATPKLYYHPDKDYCDYEPPCPPLNAFCAIKMAGMNAAEKLQLTRFANPMFRLGYVECQLNNHKCKKCPDGLKFDASRKKCGMSDCDKSFCKSRTNGNYHNPADEHGYIACSNTHTYCMPCAAGHNGGKLFFNRQDNMCKYTRDYDFPNRVVRTTPGSARGPTSGSTPGSTRAPTSGTTKAHSLGSTRAPTLGTTKAPTSGTTKAPTSASTRAPTTEAARGPILGPILLLPTPGKPVIHRIFIG